MRSPQDAEQPAQFAFRIVEDAGENAWYAGVVESQRVVDMVQDVVFALNELQPDSAVADRVDSSGSFVKRVHRSIRRIWVGWGFEQFSKADWGDLDRSRTQLERVPPRSLVGEGTIVVLVLTEKAYGELQSSAPNLASWIGGHVFELAPGTARSVTEREARLHELRLWSGLTDAAVIQRATDGTLAADPYFAEWLVLLDRGDLLGDS